MDSVLEYSGNYQHGNPIIVNENICSMCHQTINIDSQICHTCCSQALPFNHLDQEDFNLVLFEFHTDVKINVESLHQLFFNPFVFNENFAGNSDLDPDRNFFMDESLHTSYDYLLSDQFFG